MKLSQEQEISLNGYRGNRHLLGPTINELLGIIDTLLAPEPEAEPPLGMLAKGDDGTWGQYRRVQDPLDGRWDWKRIEPDATDGERDDGC